MPLNGIPVDARTLPDEIQAEARRLGLIPDLDRRKGSVSGTVSSGELDALINELTVDCYNDEEQLVGLLTGAEDCARRRGDRDRRRGRDPDCVRRLPVGLTARPDRHVRARRTAL